MANKKFSDLPVAATATLPDIYAAVQGGVSSQVTTQKVADLLGLGSGKIVLHNADGSASFAQNQIVFSVDGSATFASNNILLVADGSASFAAGIAFGSGAGSLGGDGSATFGNANLTIQADGTVTKGLWQLNPDGSGFFANQAIVFGNNGTASFAGGQLTVGDDGTVTGPGSLWMINPNGSANFAGAVAVGSGVVQLNADGSVACSGPLTVGVSGTPLVTILSATAVLDFPNTLAQTSSDLTIAVAGAAVGDTVSIGVDNGSVMANSSYSAWVSAANTVTIRFTNAGALPRDPASGTFRATVFKF